MPYKFNNGRGCVICLNCRIIIDEDLCYEEYAIEWANMPDSCMACKNDQIRDGKEMVVAPDKL